jgi:hypothetical protein
MADIKNRSGGVMEWCDFRFRIAGFAEKTF